MRILRTETKLPPIALLVAGALAACSSDMATPTEPVEPELTSGSLEVTIEETGARPDTDGYEVTIMLATQGSLIVRPVQQGTVSLLLSDLPLGWHALRIEGLAALCSITGTHPGSFLV